MDDFSEELPLCSEIIAPSADKKKGGLYLGKLEFAQTKKYREQMHVNAILSVIDKKLNLDFSGQHLTLGVTNGYRQDIAQFFAQSNEFIKTNLENTNVFVHCQYGISRSPTMVLAYLVAQNPELTVDEQIRRVSSKRPQIDPNETFIDQLRIYRDKLLAEKNNNSK